MSAVSETIVREYFELHGFFVRQVRKHQPKRLREEEEESDLLVVNPHHEAGAGPVPPVLRTTDLPGITRAVVEIKGWHTKTFGPSELESTPAIFRFVGPRAVRPVARAFGQEGPILKILVLPALPADKEAQLQSIELVRRKGVDAILPFQTVLWDLVDQVEVNRDYQKSDLLQVIRILKNYHFFRDRQLELFRGGRRRREGVAREG